MPEFAHYRSLDLLDAHATHTQPLPYFLETMADAIVQSEAHPYDNSLPRPESLKNAQEAFL